MMTHDEMIAVIQAHKEGNRIEYCEVGYGMLTIPTDWVPANTPIWDFRHYAYRVAPEPKLRPWKPEEVPVGALVALKHDERRFGKSLITHCNGIMVWTGFKPMSPVTLESLLEEMVYSTDGGKTWKPCGVEEA